MEIRPICFLLLSLLSLSALASESPILIEEISFTGLKRTREATVRRIIEPVAEGEIYTDSTGERIVQKLREAGIFNPEIEVETRLEEAGAYIEVYVEDKWTLFPIPIVSYSGSDSWMAGLVAVESNFLGLQKTLGLGFFTGSDRNSFTGFYADPRFLGTEVGLRLGAGAGRGATVDMDAEEEILREYENWSSGFSLGLSRPLGERLTLNIESGYETLEVLNRDQAISPAADTRIVTLALGADWKDLVYDIPYQRGIALQGELSRSLEFERGEFFTSAEGRLRYGLYPWRDHLIHLAVNGAWGDMPAGSQFRLGGRSGSITLPMGGVAAEEYLNGALAYNLPLNHFSSATLSGKLLFEGGYLSSDLLDSTYYYGPGFGVELFLNKVALPALGFALGWNLETGLPQSSISMGLGF